MAQSPIIVKDSTHIVKNPRQEFFDQEIDKIRGGKGIILKGYKTEKMRIEEHLRNINFYYPKKEENSKESQNFNKSSDKLNVTSNGLSIKQPEMRFKPRTDLERIFEEINKNSFRKLDKNIIEKQLKTIEMNSTKKFNNQNEDPVKEEIPDYKDAAALNMDEFFYDDFDHLGVENEKTDANKAEKEKKIKLEKSRKRELNSQAKNLMKELHNKTHFKGVSSMVNFNNQTYSPETKRKYNRTTLFLSNNNSSRAYEYPSDEDDYTLQNNFFKDSYSKRSNFRLNYNPYSLKKSADFTCDRKQLKVLRKLALEDNNPKITDKSTNNDNPRNLNNYNHEKFNHEFEDKKFNPNEERLVIDNQPFNVSQINAIAYKVLNKCNIAKSKNKNNNRVLKAGEGKLMMTNGISISEFMKKYKL